MATLPLADDVFLVGHDEDSGKPLISDLAMDTVLAGAMLGELVFADRITITDQTVVLPHNATPVGDEVTDLALSEIVKQPERYPVRAWVEHLRDAARSLVGARLERAGMVDRVEARVMLRNTVRYPARNRITAAAAEARVRYMMDNLASLDEETAALAGLLLASGLEFVIGGASSRDVRERLLGMTGVLRPELHSLIAGVESAIAALALSARR
jgi:hypothetical protein